MKYFARTIYLVLILLISNVTYAQTQLEDNNKENKAYLKANKELTTVYNKVLKEYKADVEFIKEFKNAQRIWLQLRDAEVKAKYPSTKPRFYGSIHPMCVSIYLKELTEERTKKLQVWLDGREGGDGCSDSIKIK
jgi:uncharacterized protein YecT (DUF1311 family)